jgi:hypothetical protein
MEIATVSAASFFFFFFFPRPSIAPAAIHLPCPPICLLLA